MQKTPVSAFCGPLSGPACLFCMQRWKQGPSPTIPGSSPDLRGRGDPLGSRKQKKRAELNQNHDKLGPLPGSPGAHQYYLLDSWYCEVKASSINRTCVPVNVGFLKRIEYPAASPSIVNPSDNARSISLSKTPGSRQMICSAMCCAPFWILLRPRICEVFAKELFCE